MGNFPRMLMSDYHLLRIIGRRTLKFFREFGGIHMLVARIVRNLGTLIRDRDLLIDQMVQIGVRSLPLISVVSVFAGAVSAWQAAHQLAGIMPLDFLGSAAGKAILLEMGPVLTGLVIAGRNGASMAAEIGSMVVTEQVDALESLAIDPVRYLTVPRVVAATIMLPVIVIYADAIAMLGAYIVANVVYYQSAVEFFASFREYLEMMDILVSLIKAVLFGFTTSLIGCYVGMQTTGGAKGVGSSAIRAFVFSAAVILINDFLVTMIML